MTHSSVYLTVKMQRGKWWKRKRGRAGKWPWNPQVYGTRTWIPRYMVRVLFALHHSSFHPKPTLSVSHKLKTSFPFNLTQLSYHMTKPILPKTSKRKKVNLNLCVTHTHDCQSSPKPVTKTQELPHAVLFLNSSQLVSVSLCQHNGRYAAHQTQKAAQPWSANNDHHALYNGIPVKPLSLLQGRRRHHELCEAPRCTFQEAMQTNSVWMNGDVRQYQISLR